MAPHREPRWVDRLVVETVQLDLVREHGGMVGVRDDDALEAALARPRHKWSYGRPDLAELAAAYAFALVRDHPFNDGNKRVAFVTMAVFLGLNGWEVQAGEEDVVAVVTELAAGGVSEDALVGWIRERMTRRGRP